MADTDSKSVLLIFVMDTQKAKIKQRAGKPMAKAITAACANFGLQRNAVKFTYNGERVQDDSTPTEMGMLDEEDYDTEGVEVQGHAWQEGGF
ncbi:hypothetical protein BKA62DRAFT_696990 [Auriculariales sp. MPI-PUGE-AT-0066]|nr:hypothetical protein BKA62DRAFT_696990 [Auriculariales sp. MPI-PUGE-AT-0066]